MSNTIQSLSIFNTDYTKNVKYTEMSILQIMRVVKRGTSSGRKNRYIYTEARGYQNESSMGLVSKAAVFPVYRFVWRRARSPQKRGRSCPQ